ncbi:MAG: NAD-dependent dehydratase [Bacteroidetes bacterium HGW-Bacteroidetes-22]|nr:MAG: NAD-dependent dehydratase [Bacteroidetes bacterium HGW-Bacteroidetes-22]
MKKETVVITGATGFIGGFLVEEAFKRDMNIFCVVRKSSDLSRISLPGVRFLYFHPEDAIQLDAEMAQFSIEYGCPDYFIHNAGITKSVRTSDFDRVNAQHTARFAAGVARHFSSLKRFVLMSSLAAQGPGNDQNLKPITISDYPIPNTLYGKSKLTAEKLLKQFTNIPWVILRPTGVYGPREHDYYLYLKSLTRGIEPVMGFKEQHLSFLYVTDLVQAVFLSLTEPVVGETFLLSDGNNYTGTEYGDIAREALNCKAIRVRIPLQVVRLISSLLEYTGRITKNTPTLNNDKFLSIKALNWTVDINETQMRLKYHPQVDLRTGLRLCVEWYRKNKWL